MMHAIAAAIILALLVGVATRVVPSDGDWHCPPGFACDARATANN